ncbi:NUDIX domain-containing protein [Streptomyces sp. NPDC049954]|uniref:NUDIX domain-containing protein n=1 Tax=Streptomyces sp. NPDC049954 TaxID=3155779 RepID=UPI00343321CF
MTFATRDDDLRAEPVRLAPEEYARSRAAFWGGSAVLFTDVDGRVLVVEPRYREHLLLPGGGMDAGERPSRSAAREVAEELALVVRPSRLLVVEWVSEDHEEYAEFGCFPGEALYVWDGGVLGPGALARIVLPPAELGAYHLLSAAEAAARMGPLDGARMLAAYRARLDASGPAVLEDGTATAPGVLERHGVVPGTAPAAGGATGVWAFDPQGRVLLLVDPEGRHCALPSAHHAGLYRDIPLALPGRAGAVARLAPGLVAPSGGPAHLLAPPAQAAALLGPGGGTCDRARAAAALAAERWGVPRAAPRPVEEITPDRG